MIRRGVRAIALLALGAVIVVVLLSLTTAGSIATVRAWVRAERLWSRDLPLASGRGWLRRVEPALTAVAVLRPVRVDVAPGVSLLLDPADDISRTILVSRRSTWEPEVWSAIEAHLPPGAVFMDVGAHIGYDSLKAAVSVGPGGQVIAFEPNPRTAAALRANIAASGATNIVVQEIACSDSETALTFFDSTAGGNSGASSLAADNAGASRSAFTVRARPIDAVVHELGLARIDVLKADVEGAELLVLRGAQETLRRWHPRLVLEVVPRQLENMGTSVEELERLIWSLGYTQSRQVDYKNREYWAAR